MHDQRLTTRLIDYWTRLRKDLPIPQWQSFNGAAFDDLWQQCCGWRVDQGNSNTFTYTYEHVGQSVREAIGSDLTGKIFNSRFNNFPGATISKSIDNVVKNPTPLIEESQFINEKNKIVKYRSCLLPFGKDGKVTHIVLGLSWKAF
jgi:hypothetical protein